MHIYVYCVYFYKIFLSHIRLASYPRFPKAFSWVVELQLDPSPTACSARAEEMLEFYSWCTRDVLFNPFICSVTFYSTLCAHLCDFNYVKRCLTKGGNWRQQKKKIVLPSLPVWQLSRLKGSCYWIVNFYKEMNWSRESGIKNVMRQVFSV